MKKQNLIMYAIVIAILGACGEEKKEHQDKKENPAAKTNTAQSATANTNASTSIKEIVSRYLDLKNAFVSDNTKEAAAAGKALEASFKNFDKKNLDARQIKVYDDVEDDAREHAEHIGANGGNIEHQREHFDILSKDIYDLVKEFGSEQPLYKFFCPMANDGKGAVWLSEYKETKNPYYGKKMMTCGEVKEEIK